MDRVPILGLGDVLLVSIQIDLQDRTALALQEDLSDRIVEIGARGVIIDISALEIVDSFIGRMLSTVAAISNVLDAETVVVGMRPAVAITLVELGLSLGGVRTALDVERALAIIESSDRRRAPAGGNGEVEPGGMPGPDAVEPGGRGQPVGDGSVRVHDLT